MKDARFLGHLLPLFTIIAIAACRDDTNPSSTSSENMSPSFNYTALNKAGDTMSGFLTLFADPAQPLHATSKQYVDAAIDSAIATLPQSPWVDVRNFGAKGDGVTNDSTAIQNAINYANNLSKGSGGTVIIPLGHFNLGSNGILLYEGIKLVGMGRGEYVSATPAGGSWLIYSGTGNAVTIDGEWTGFDSRREIALREISIKASGNAAIYADFLTQYEITNVNIRGTATYGLYMVNSYNGKVSRLKVDGPVNGLHYTIKTAPDDVFSGQTLFEACDFWNSNGYGAKLTAFDNVLAQIVFHKVHFKTNGTGLILDGANLHKTTIAGAHFEANTANDLVINSNVTRGPNVIGSFFNNTTPVYKIDCQGSNSVITGNEFTGSGSGYGILVTGANNRIVDNIFYNLANSIVINTAASGMLLGRNEFLNPVGNRIADSGTSTIYEGEQTIESKEFTLNGPTEIDVKLKADKPLWIRNIEIMYTETTSADTGVNIFVGTSSNNSKFATFLSETNKSVYDVSSVALTAKYLAPGDILLFKSAGNKTGSGKLKIVARLIPFPY